MNKIFAAAVLGLEIGSPLKKLLRGVILGGERFKEKILDRIITDNLSKKEVSHPRKLEKSLDYESVIQAVYSYFNARRRELLDRKRECRDLAIYLIKKLAPLTNREIAELFGNVSYSAITRVYKRFAQEAEKRRSGTSNSRTLKKNCKMSRADAPLDKRGKVE